MFTLILIGTILGLTSAQIISEGKCPELAGQQNFQLDQYLGVWYENEKFPSQYSDSTKCGQATLSMLPNNTLLVKDSALSKITNKQVEFEGTAQPLESGQFYVRFPTITKYGKVEPNFTVLGTDYKSYTVIYSCYYGENNSTQRAEFAWIFTRARFAPLTVMAEARNVLTKNNIPADYLKPANQMGCFDE